MTTPYIIFDQNQLTKFYFTFPDWTWSSHSTTICVISVYQVKSIKQRAHELPFMLFFSSRRKKKQKETDNNTTHMRGFLSAERGNNEKTQHFPLIFEFHICKTSPLQSKPLPIHLGKGNDKCRKIMLRCIFPYLLIINGMSVQKKSLLFLLPR